MATIQQEIMTIAEAQGYEGKSGGTIAEAVNALSSVMGGGGGGGAEPLIVTISMNMGQLSADKTAAEIVEHIDGGGDVIAVHDQSMGAKASVQVFRMQRYGRNYASFATFDRDSSGRMMFYYLGIDETGVTLNSGSFTPSSN